MEPGQTAYSAFCRGLGITSGWATLPDRAKNAWFTVECVVGNVSLLYQDVPQPVIDHIKLTAESPGAVEVGPGFDLSGYVHVVRDHEAIDRAFKALATDHEHTAAEAQRSMARGMGYTGDTCDRCGSVYVKRTGKCTTCEACGNTGGCG